MSETLIELRGIKKHYGKIRALDGVDLMIPKGCILGIVGPNGAGKTTLFSILCGYIRHDSGEIRVNGRTVEPGGALPLRLVTYPQDAGMMTMPISKHLIYYATLDGFDDKDKATKEASRVLHMVDLPEVWGRYPRTLSHGMRKRVGIAQAFIGKPDLLIFDEPMAGLDPVSARKVRALIREAAADRTVLISSHDLDHVQDVCQEVAILDRGKVVRMEAMENLVSIGGEVAFKINKPPGDEVLATLKGISFVTDVSWDAGDLRLRVFFDASSASAEDASSQLVQTLASKGVVFTEMQVGRRLEDLVREETS